MNTEAPDPVQAAIDNVEQKAAEAAAGEEPKALVHDVKLANGKRIRLVVPFEFGPDEFESAVAMLMELRVHSEAQQAARKNAGLIVPEAPKLVVP